MRSICETEVHDYDPCISVKSICIKLIENHSICIIIILEVHMILITFTCPRVIKPDERIGFKGALVV